MARRLHGGRRAVPTVIAFHGLEPLYHEALREESEQSGGLSWRYRLLQERLMPFMLRTACRHATRVSCLNTLEKDYLVRRGWVGRRSRGRRLSRRAGRVLSPGTSGAPGADAALRGSVAAHEGRQVPSRCVHRARPSPSGRPLDLRRHARARRRRARRFPSRRAATREGHPASRTARAHRRLSRGATS